MPDLGAFEVTGDPIADRGRFRVPSLRNVEVTAPYMHDGRFATARRAVDRSLRLRRSGRTRTCRPQLRGPDGRSGQCSIWTEGQRGPPSWLFLLATLTDDDVPDRRALQPSRSAAADSRTLVPGTPCGGECRSGPTAARCAWHRCAAVGDPNGQLWAGVRRSSRSRWGGGRRSAGRCRHGGRGRSSRIPMAASPMIGWHRRPPAQCPRGADRGPPPPGCTPGSRRPGTRRTRPRSASGVLVGRIRVGGSPDGEDQAR